MALRLRRSQVSAAARWMHEARLPTIREHLRRCFAIDKRLMEDDELDALIRGALDRAVDLDVRTLPDLLLLSNLSMARHLGWIADKDALDARETMTSPLGGPPHERLRRAYRALLYRAEIDAGHEAEVVD